MGRTILLVLLACSSLVSVVSSFSPDVKLFIDCGSPSNSTDSFNTTWISDRFYTGGASTVVSEPLHFTQPQEKTLRYFPLSSGKKNCYIVPVPVGRYFFRQFSVYDNYDGRSHSPSFDVSVEGTLVFMWRSPWTETNSRFGAYSDLFANVTDGEADICFYSIATDSPVVGALEIIQVHPFSYAAGGSSLLVNYGRLSCGSDQSVTDFAGYGDPFGRTWESDANYRSKDSDFKTLTTKHPIANTSQPPNYFPEKLYQTALRGPGLLKYEFTVDAKMDYLLVFHFAEIDTAVTAANQRVIDIVVNNNKVTRVDIFAQVGAFAAYSYTHTVRNLSSQSINVRFEPISGYVLVCGIENYAIVPYDASTNPEQVLAMRALKESLRVPDRMGWNGDPCAPTSWDAWEGVTCHPSGNGSASRVITQIDLGSQGLKGYISDQISHLVNLVSLNLSSNSLGGPLPSELGHSSLTNLDLSNNQFNGPIPESLKTAKLNLVLLNNNQLSGRVPEELYSIGLHGGSINLSANKGLCGVPSLPKCSLLWDNGRLSTGGKVAITISVVVVILILLVVAYICYLRRRNDYDFAPTHDLMSMAAKRNRYHRQKSLMHLEMESQHAKGLVSSQGPS